MKKLLFILLMTPVFCFGQTRIKIGQADTSSTGFQPKANSLSLSALQTKFNLYPLKTITLTINGTTLDLSANRSWTISGGTPGGSTTHIQFNSAGAFGGDANFYWDNTNKTLASGVTSVNLVPDTAEYIGDSVTGGTGLPTPATQCFPFWVSNGTGLKQDNRGIGGATILTYGTSAIPTKTATRNLLFIEFGVNDSAANDTATFHTNFTTFVAAAITKGWIGAQIYIISINGVAYSSGSDALYKKYNTVLSQVATAKGCTYVDVYSTLQNSTYGGSTFLQQNAGSFHPTILGAFITGQIILQSVNQPNFNFGLTTPAAALKAIETTSLTIKNPTVNNSATGFTLAGIDNNGKFIRTTILPDSILFGKRSYFGGSIIENGSYIEPDFNYSQDIALLQGAAIGSANSSNVYSRFIPFTAGGVMEFRNYYGSGTFDFYTANTSNGSQLLGFQVQKTGRPLMLVGGDITQGQTIKSSASSTVQLVWTPFDANGLTTFDNQYAGSTAAILWKMAPTTSGTTNGMMQLFHTGHLMLQNGGTFTDVASSIFTLNSTTVGSIPYPQMTTTQKNAISSPAEGLAVYDLTLHKLYVYDGTTWQAAW